MSAEGTTSRRANHNPRRGLKTSDSGSGYSVRKPKRKLTAAERRARRERKRKYMTAFLNGKQKRVPRPPEIDGLTVDEFIARNADPIWLHQNELWELMQPYDEA